MVVLGVFEVLVLVNSRIRAFMAKFLPNTLLVMISFLVALLFAEGIARIVYKERFVVFELHGIHRASPNPEVVYELRPGAELTFFYKDQGEEITYDINSLGLRGSEVTNNKPPRTFRVVTLGDSVTFGVRVDQPDIYSARLQEMLNGWSEDINLNATFEVLNPSACGWNTFNEVSWLENRGIELNPDFVLVQFSMNDVDNPIAHMGTTVLYHLKEIPEDFFPIDPGDAGEESVFLKTADDISLKDVVQWYGPKFSKIFAFAQQVYIAQKMKAEAAKENKPPPVWLSWCLDILVDEGTPQVNWLKGQLARLQSFSDEHNIPVVVVIFPLSYQLNSDNETWTRAIDKVEEYIKGAGLESLNLTPAYEKVSKDDQFHLYLRSDASHLNPEGHSLTAETLKDFLVETPAIKSLVK
jgi:lysophospholipase L1-like esterase